MHMSTAHQSHEVLSYSSKSAVFSLWKKLLASIFKYNRNDLQCLICAIQFPYLLQLQWSALWRKDIFLSLHIIRMCFGDSLLWAHKLLGANIGISCIRKSIHLLMAAQLSLLININLEPVNTCNFHPHH